MNKTLSGNHFGDNFKYYISLIDDNLGLINGLEKSFKKTKETLDLITEEQGNYAYATDKWTVKELLVHLIDSERILVYRALCFARNETLDLPGYNHDDYVRCSGANDRILEDIYNEYNLVRLSTIALFNSFNEDMLVRYGTANDVKTTVLSLGYIITGHEIHHINVLREKYL